MITDNIFSPKSFQRRQFLLADAIRYSAAARFREAGATFTRAIAYAVVAWLLMQIAQIAFENYRGRLNRLFDVESDDLYRAE